MYDFMFEVVGEDSELCGEQFFAECNTKGEAWRIANFNFPNEELHYLGKYSCTEPDEMIRLDIY